MKQNIIAVDFDGTLCENKWPEIGMPNEELIEYLKKRQTNGEKLILWTSRNEEQTQDAVEWCKKYGLIFDAVNDNLPEIVEAFGGNCRKIFANEYIDDRNLGDGDTVTFDELKRRYRMSNQEYIYVNNILDMNAKLCAAGFTTNIIKRR